jgi:hypothetical protein
MRSVYVNVSMSDIIFGDRCAASHCPVAYALRRQFGTTRVSVLPHSARVMLAKDIHYYNLPKEAAEFIMAFDAGQYVKPISFTMVLQGD